MDKRMDRWVDRRMDGQLHVNKDRLCSGYLYG